MPLNKDQELTPVQWMDKAVNTLYLELPDDVARDVSDKWRSAKEYLQSKTAWAIWKQKAEGYEKALKEIIKVVDETFGAESKYTSPEAEIATKALESFNQNKVK